MHFSKEISWIKLEPKPNRTDGFIHLFSNYSLIICYMSGIMLDTMDKELYVPDWEEFTIREVRRGWDGELGRWDNH